MRWSKGLPALLALLPFLFFAPVVTGTARFRFGDFITQFWSFATYRSQSLWSGQLPLWTPYLFAGYPFAAEPQAAVFYPPGWLTVVLNGPGPSPCDCTSWRSWPTSPWPLSAPICSSGG